MQCTYDEWVLTRIIYLTLNQQFGTSSEECWEHHISSWLQILKTCSSLCLYWSIVTLFHVIVSCIKLTSGISFDKMLFFFYLHLQRLLFFVHRPVGMPKMEKVYLHNPSSEQISLISISATTAHFHASFFQNRVSTSHFKTTLRRSHEWLLILPRFMRHFQTSETLFKKNNMSFSHLSGDVCFLDLL